MSVAAKAEPTTRAMYQAQRTRMLREPRKIVARAFLRAVVAVADAAKLSAVVDATETAVAERSEAALAALDGLLAWNATALQREIAAAQRDTLEVVGDFALRMAQRTGAAEEDDIPESAKARRRELDVTDQAAVDWIREHGTELIEDLSKRRREALRDLIQEAYLRGDAPSTLARRLVRERLFGLTPRYTRAVSAYRRRLLAEGKSLARVNVLTERYAKRLLAQRAEAIARTELAHAFSQGQLAGWRQAIKDKLIPGAARSRWNTVDPCPICAPLEGKTARIGQRFYPGGFRYPPEPHPLCECFLTLVTAADARRLRGRR